MNEAIFTSSLSIAGQLLKDVDILRHNGIKKLYSNGVSNHFLKASLSEDYFKMYKVAIQNFDYDFLLEDQSIFQFTFERKHSSGILDLRYAYFQNPTQFKTYEEYLDHLRMQGIIEDESNEEIGDSLLEEYEQFLIEQQVNQAATTIRFDLDTANYKALVHSTAHIHFGHNNMIRVPCDKFITPVNFIIFVLKHVYYYKWKEMINGNHADLKRYLDDARVSCSTLPNNFWNSNIETKELYLT